MVFQMKINELHCEIKKQLVPLIDNDYVLWDLPYYNNIGDILIWEGERQFLNKLPYKCLNSASLYTCTFPKLDPDTIILLQGGGNFGDLWREHQNFRLKVIESYPDNRIIVFPQTVYYEDVEQICRDNDKMRLHKRLTLCARDLLSYNLLKDNFENQVLLLPDMAFCIEEGTFRKWRKKEKSKTLFLQRLDKEAVDVEGLGILQLEENLDIRDWPSIEKESWSMYVFNKMVSLQSILTRKRIRSRGVNFILDWIASSVFRPLLLKQGIGFVSSYHYIYTTRLHVMILSILLHKRVKFIDNSYGKNSSFYDTWLKDLNGVEPYF
ncbi:polysaccharide pyruvyl transferase YvfF [Bacteroides faecichinchillae]|nr:polysaccharide pyruvyl transferase YvfF [Bacteroides faecichinchillae]